jgi:hypothetical protein
VTSSTTRVRLAWSAGVLVVLLAALSWRVVSEGRSELLASDAAWQAGDVVGATFHARAAARAYVPFAPYVDRAYRKLYAIAEESEARGNREAALFAWRAVRAAAIGSRSFLTSHDRERSSADVSIARLSTTLRAASQPPPRWSTGVSSRGQGAALAAAVPPKMGWGALVVAGAALWVAGAISLTRKAWDRAGRFQSSELWTPLATAIAGLIAWWVALLMA